MVILLGLVVDPSTAVCFGVPRYVRLVSNAWGSTPPTGSNWKSGFVCWGAEAFCIDAKIKEHVSGRTYRGNSTKGGGSED